MIFGTEHGWGSEFAINSCWAVRIWAQKLGISLKIFDNLEELYQPINERA